MHLEAKNATSICTHASLLILEMLLMKWALTSLHRTHSYDAIVHTHDLFDFWNNLEMDKKNLHAH
jgi:hypothetical protein